MLLDDHHEFLKIFGKVQSEKIQHATANPVGNLARLILFTLGGTGLVYSPISFPPGGMIGMRHSILRYFQY